MMQRENRQVPAEHSKQVIFPPFKPLDFLITPKNASFGQHKKTKH